MRIDQTSVLPRTRESGWPRWLTRRRAGSHAGSWSGWLFALPALATYAVFNFWPVVTAIKLSFFNWDGIGPQTWAGLDNYRAVFSQPELLSSLVHAFYLIIFFAILPVTFGLISAAVMREIRGGLFGTVARTTLFLPQIIPGAAAAVAWTWMYSQNGVVNQVLSAIGLGSITRAWLADFNWSLTAVGLIGTWLLTGFCTLLLMSGIGKIDASIYEAASIDGAGPWSAFLRIHLPLARPSLAALATLMFLSTWNSFLLPLVLISNPNQRTMAGALQAFVTQYTTDQVLLNAGALLLMAPTIIVFLVLQRFFIQALLQGAVKG